MTDGFKRGEHDATAGYPYNDSVDTEESIPSSYGTGFIVGYGIGFVPAYDAMHGYQAFLEDSLDNNN